MKPIDVQLSFEDVNSEYKAFVEKFKPKKTTDDCYTPENVYEAIKDWVCKEYGVSPENVVRPFWPGGNYEKYPYKETDVVIDNPPFSIIGQIVKFYNNYEIPYFLFSPYLTNFTGGMHVSHLITGQGIVYENGAEYEGLPMYVFSEASTRHAISRSSYREFQKGDIVQLNLSAKIDGYSAAIGYPICLGKLEGQRKEIVQFCRDAHAWSEQQIKAGVYAADIAKGFYKYYVDNGYEKNYVYGPLHGTGIIEVEAPWCETSSDYYLKPNMCYQVDTFISADTFGVRWEKGIVVTENGFEKLSPEIPLICPEKHF